MPCSRATSDACAATEPPWVTPATARAKSGVQAGAVIGATQDLTFLESSEVRGG
jgi:hypothetical protein